MQRPWGQNKLGQFEKEQGQGISEKATVGVLQVLGLTQLACKEARYKRNVLHVCPMCVAIGFLFYDHPVFIYLEPGQIGFPVFTLLTSIEMSRYSIGTRVPPFTGCQHT